MNAEEMRRTSVWVVELATALVLLGVAVAKVSPDIRRVVTMRACRIVSRQAKRNAEVMSALAAKADTVYWQLSNV